MLTGVAQFVLPVQHSAATPRQAAIKQVTLVAIVTLAIVTLAFVTLVTVTLTIVTLVTLAIGIFTITITLITFSILQAGLLSVLSSIPYSQALVFSNYSTIAQVSTTTFTSHITTSNHHFHHL